jgi:predicted small lipoprotein YifL
MRFLLILAVAIALTACGQKGPLYLRDKPPPGMKPPKPPPVKPVPYPDEPQTDSPTQTEGR